MKRGRTPKPTALKLLQGTVPSRVNDDEPDPGPAMPVCPADASPEVQVEWNYTLHNLMIMGIAAPADRDALYAYVQAVVTHRRASRMLAESDLMIEGHRGVLIRHPAIAVQREAAMVMRQYAHEFGLTPAARSEIRMSNLRPSTSNDAGRYLTG